jgi:hypothetical protein
MSVNPTNLLYIVQASQCDVDFWTQQLTEHTLFLHKLLNPAAVPALKEEAKKHYAAWYALLKQNPVPYDATMTASLYAFLEVIHNKIGTNTVARQGGVAPINLELSLDDFHALIKHMISEQTYFVRLVEGKVTIKDELLFWAQENAEHTELISHLLPAGDLKNQTAEISDSLKRTRVLSIYDQAYFSDELPLIKRSNNTTATIHGFIHSGQITSINDAMLEHEMREAQKGEERVQYLLGLLQ